MPILIIEVVDKIHRFHVSNELVDAYSGGDLYDHFKLWVRNKLRSGGVSPDLSDIKCHGLVDVSVMNDKVLETMNEKGSAFDLLSLGCRMASMVLGKPRSQLADDEVSAGVRHVKWLRGDDVEPPFTLKIKQAILPEYEDNQTGH